MPFSQTESLSGNIQDVQSTIGGLIKDTVATGQNTVAITTNRGGMAIAQKRASDYVGSDIGVGKA